MDSSKSSKKQFGGKPANLQEEDPSGYNAPENFDILLEKSKELYYESASFTISMLQERFDISFQTAAKVMDTLEDEGVFADEDDADGEWEGDL